ncbi:MAG: hypothetical protein LBC85_01425 [Fibromonadaceae bacterium]|jgi:hypothetical protein|nr:hypothetical protein [Fibromonadaceae bacterium]
MKVTYTYGTSENIIGADMEINLGILNYSFINKPLLIGGKAMEYYGLRKAGSDIDFVIHNDDHKILKEIYPNNIKDLYGDIGICEYGFEIWNQICTFDYNYLKEGAIEENNYKIISLEKLLFLKALAMEIPKYHKDLQMIVKLILNKAYEKQQNG